MQDFRMGGFLAWFINVELPSYNQFLQIYLAVMISSGYDTEGAVSDPRPRR